MESLISLRGVVTHVTYTSNKGNFCVFKLRHNDEESSHNTTCTGFISDIKKGLILTLYGNYITNQYGKSFSFSKFEYSEPLISDEIIGYLSSGLIDEVDYITAKKIYNAFGDNTIKILDESPEKLIEIKGIANKKSRAIIESWQTHRDNLDMHIFLQKYGLSTEIITSLKEIAQRKYMGIKKLITTMKYHLIYELSGLTFDTIDAILFNIDTDNYNKQCRSSYERVECAAYSYIQHYIFESGNLCIPITDLVNGIYNKLSLSYEEVMEILHNGYKDTVSRKVNRLRIITKVDDNDNTTIDDSSLVYIAVDYYRENVIARFLVNTYYSSIKNESINHFKNHNADNLLIEVEKELEVTYNEQQKEAIDTVLTNPITIITGGPGTGKTTIIKGIIGLLEKFEGLSVCLLAPTGKAAKRMSDATNHPAKTIHMALITEQDKISEYDAIIVDESSMIDNTLMAILLSHLSNEQRIVLVGDIHQLPSVGPGNVLSNIINSNVFPTVYLTQIYRQEDGYIIENAHRINNGQMPLLYNNNSKDFYYIDQVASEMSSIEILHKLLTEVLPCIPNLPEGWLKELQILSPMRRGESGVHNLNKYMQDFYKSSNYKAYELARESWHLERIKRNKLVKKNKLLEDNMYVFSIMRNDAIYCVGDRVMNTKNNYEKMVFNGEVGYITKIELKEEVVEKVIMNPRARKDKFFDSDYNIYISFGDNETPICFSYEQMESISLSYCITIHKSQGSEYPFLILFLNKSHWIMQQRNLIYTGITRAKKMIILISDYGSIGRAVSNNEAIHRITLLQEQIQYYYNNPKRAQGYINPIPLFYVDNDRTQNEGTITSKDSSINKENTKQTNPLSDIVDSLTDDEILNVVDRICTDYDKSYKIKLSTILTSKRDGGVSK